MFSYREFLREFRRTVFFKRGGGLVLFGIVLSALSFTLLTYQYLPESINPQQSYQSLIKVSISDYYIPFTDAPYSGKTEIPKSGHTCTDGNDGVKTTGGILGTTKYACNKDSSGNQSICTDIGDGYLRCSATKPVTSLYTNNGSNSYTCSTDKLKITKTSGEDVISCPSIGGQQSYCYNTAGDTNAYACGIPGNPNPIITGPTSTPAPSSGLPPSDATCNLNNPQAYCVGWVLSPGNDLYNPPALTSDASACWARCNSDPNCLSYSWHKVTSNGLGECWEKNIVNTPIKNIEYNSGLVYPKTPAPTVPPPVKVTPPPAGPPPGTNLLTGTCDHGGIVVDGPGGSNIDTNFSGQVGNAYYGTDNNWYACTSKGWYGPITAGSCLNGNIIDATTGSALTTEFVGEPNQFVCGADFQNWQCNGAGVWVAKGGSCGRPASTCTGTNKLACNSDCWSVTSSACAVPYSCPTGAGGPTCSQPAGGSSGGGSGSGSGGNQTPPPPLTTPTLPACQNNGTTSLACGQKCLCVGAGDASCDHSQITLDSPTNTCGTGAKWTCASGASNPICQPATSPTSAISPTVATSPTVVTSPIVAVSDTPIPGLTSTNAPTSTPIITGTSIGLYLTLDGVGSNASIGQNNNPINANMPVQVQIFDVTGNKIQETSGTLNYNSQSAQFEGVIALGNLPTNPYNIKVRFNNTLWKRVSSIITAGQSTKIPSVKLINGDLNGDNQLDLLDYTTMISCYGTGQCSQKAAADLNLDGVVDEKDLNLLYSHFAVREGD
ncbi:MAG TPA: dockerin type I domain-containing protein [Patescibacteria group bacterium]|nr:dockerin type I domain-containing protein [Patescibacteria group bacterium]